MTPPFHFPDEIFEKMNICRVVDIDNNSHCRNGTSLRKNALVMEKKGLAIRIALFHLLTIKNDPEVSLVCGYPGLRRMLSHMVHEGCGVPPSRYP